MAVRRSRDPGRAARFRFRSIPRCPPPRSVTSSGLRCRNRRRLDAAPAREDSGDPSSAAGASGGRRDGRRRGRARRRRSCRLPTATERGHARMVGEWGAAKQFRDVARAVRPGAARDDHLHIGHDGRAEGRDADARRARVEPASPRRRCSTCRRSDVGLSFLPLSHAFERDGRMGVPALRRARGLRGVVRHGRPRHRRWSGRRSLTGVPRVYEKLQARIMSKGGASAPAMQRHVFRWAVGRGRQEGARDAARTIGRVRSIACRRGWRIGSCSAKVRERARRPGALSRLRQRSAGDRRRRVLLRARPADHRRVRPDRDRRRS